MRYLISLILAFICFSSFFLGSVICAESGYVDVHIHLDPIGLKQRKAVSSGKRPGYKKQNSQAARFDYAGMAKNIISYMDEMNVEKAVLMPPPQASSQERNPGTYKDCFMAASYYPQRIFVGGGGDNLNLLINQYGREEVTPEVYARFRRAAKQLLDAGVVAFGEMAALHLSMQEHHIFSQVDPDHPLFLLLSDIASKNNIPIDFHMEAVPEDIPTPDSLLRISRNNPEILKANIKGFERLLEHNRKAKIVWQHIGWDNIGYMTAGLLRDLLIKYPNLYLALRVAYRQEKMDQSGPMPNRIVDKNWNVYPEWREFIIEFSDRIVIGADEFMGVARQESRPKDSFIETWSILEQFPPEIARKIGYDNAAWIYNLEKV